MNELWLLYSLLLGVLLGAVFFGGLWWTVRRAVASDRVALWFFGSFILRIVIVLAGFYLACGDDWHRWLAAALGFGIARVVIARIIRADIKPQQEAAQSHHAT